MYRKNNKCTKCDGKGSITYILSRTYPIDYNKYSTADASTSNNFTAKCQLCDGKGQVTAVDYMKRKKK